MDQGPLVIEEIEAGAELAREFDRYEPIKVAFWLKAGDEGQRYLYLASDRIDGTNLDVAYGEVLRLTTKIDSPDLDPFRVKLIGGKTPLAQAALEHARRFPNPRGTRFSGAWFGGMDVDDVYIYPSPLPAAVS